MREEDDDLSSDSSLAESFKSELVLEAVVVRWLVTELMICELGGGSGDVRREVGRGGGGVYNRPGRERSGSSGPVTLAGGSLLLMSPECVALPPKSGAEYDGYLSAIVVVVVGRVGFIVINIVIVVVVVKSCARM